MILILKNGRKFEVQEDLARTLVRNIRDSTPYATSVNWAGETDESQLLEFVRLDEIALIFSESERIKEIIN